MDGSGKTPKRRPLGRGLDALLPNSSPPQPGSPRQTLQVAVEELNPSRSQPRQRFDDTALDELAASIRELGVLEPLLVRKSSSSGYDIVAGERRWRAAQRAGVLKVPVFVRELSDKQAFEAALVENLQREDLNPVETARAFQRLVEEHEHTADSIAKRLGKSRSAVSNVMRLLNLPDAVLTLIENDELSEGHGRALLGLQSPEDMLRYAKDAVDKQRSVREVERVVRHATQNQKSKLSPKARSSANLRDLEERLSKALGAKVYVTDRNGRGKISIPFSSYDELDAFLERVLD